MHDYCNNSHLTMLRFAIDHLYSFALLQFFIRIITTVGNDIRNTGEAV